MLSAVEACSLKRAVSSVAAQVRRVLDGTRFEGFGDWLESQGSSGQPMSR